MGPKLSWSKGVLFNIVWVYTKRSAPIDVGAREVGQGKDKRISEPDKWNPMVAPQ